MASISPGPAAAPARNWLRWLPGLALLRSYEAAWLPRDVAAGLVLTTMLVPVGIAYAEASGVPGVYGLYATIIPLLAYALFAFSAFVIVIEPMATESVDTSLASTAVGIISGVG